MRQEGQVKVSLLSQLGGKRDFIFSVSN